MSRKTIETVIKNTISESEDEFGYVFGHPGSLYDIFVKPVTDAGRVAGAEAKKTLARGKHLARTAVEALVSTLVPILDADYDKIDDEAKRKIEQAESQAGDAYDEIKRALGGSDAIMFSLLYAPVAMITLAASSKITDKLKKAFGVQEGVKVGDQRLQDLSSAVRDAVQQKLQSFVALSKKISAAHDASALAATLGKKMKLDNSSDVTAIKQKLIMSIAKKISDEKNDLIKRGVPKAAKIVKDYDKTISLISRIGEK